MRHAGGARGSAGVTAAAAESMSRRTDCGEMSLGRPSDTELRRCVAWNRADTRLAVIGGFPRRAGRTIAANE